MNSKLVNLSSTSVFKRLEQLIVILIVASIFLYPATYGPTRLENYILPLLLFVLVIKRPVFDRTIVILLVGNLLIGLLSVYVNLHFNYGLLELIRWIKYILILVYFSSLGSHVLGSVSLAIRLSFFGMVFINLIQIFNPMNLGSEIVSIYSHHPLFQAEKVELDNTFRLMGTAINPNNNAVLWLLMAVYFLVEFYESRKVPSLIYLFISFLFIIFTQSRTAIVVMLFMGMLNLSLYKFTFRNIIFILASLLTGAFIAIWLKFTYLWHIFLFNPMKIHSLQLRFAIWRDMLKLFYDKPLFGWGNLKNYETLYPKAPDNEFLFILLNQGSLGLLGVMLIFIYTFFHFMHHKKKFRFSYLPIFMVICLLIIGMTNLAFTNVRVGMYFFMIWGLAASYRNNQVLKIDGKS